MINFTVKTLDAHNHTFCVDDNTTVRQLKELIYQRTEWPRDQQRFIFCGRVLSDDANLKAINLDGKVLHLVQCEPPLPDGTRRRSSSNPGDRTRRDDSEGREARPSANSPFRRLMLFDHEIGNNLFLNTLGVPTALEDADGGSSTPTAARIAVARRMLNNIRTTLDNLESEQNAQDSDDSFTGDYPPDIETMDTDCPPPDADQSEEEFVPDDDEEEQSTPEATQEPSSDRSAGTGARRRGRPTHRVHQVRPREMMQIITDLTLMHPRIEPFMQLYVQALNPRYHPGSEENTVRRQSIVNQVSEIMHSMSHIYHAMSEIGVDVDCRSQRLSSEPPHTRTHIPIQVETQINVLASRRPPGQPGQPGRQTTSTRTSTTSTATSATATASGTTTATSQSPTAESTNTQTARHSTHPTVNINIRPEPMTYQVEIETRVPIAFALNNSMLSGIAGGGGGAGGGGAEAEAGGGGASAGPARPQGAAAAASSTVTSQSAGDQQRNANILSALFGNLADRPLFSGMESGSDGVEVVMEMNPNSLTGQTAQPGIPSQMLAGAFPMPNELQQIVQAAIRRGIGPHADLHVQGQPSGNQTASMQFPPQAQAGQPTGGVQQRTERHLIPIGIPTGMHAFDRFLTCDNVHTRRYLQARRSMQPPLNPVAAFNNSSEIFMQPMLNNLLNGLQGYSILDLIDGDQPAGGSWLNEIFTLMARELSLGDLLRTVMGISGNLDALRLPLRQFVESRILAGPAPENADEAMEIYTAASDRLVDQHQNFIDRMSTLVTLRTDIDIERSIRALARARLPAIFLSIMAGDVTNNTDGFSSSMTTLISRTFTDLCALVMYCCAEGPNGLQTLYRSYVQEFTNHLEPELQRFIIALSVSNLSSTLTGVNTRQQNIQGYICRNRAPVTRRARANTPPHVTPTQDEAQPSASHQGTSSNAERDAETGQTRTEATLNSSKPPTPKRAYRQRTPQAESSTAFSGASEMSENRPRVESTCTTSDATAEGMPRTWGPIITGDEARQGAAAGAVVQPPFSDAYLSGRSRKRKLQWKKSQSIRRLVQESIQEATSAVLGACEIEATQMQASEALSDVGLRLAYHDYVRTMARRRAYGSEDFASDRYPACYDYFIKRPPLDDDTD